MHRTYLEIGEDTNQEEVDLINLTEPLITISALNKKYSTIEYDNNFLQNLDESEYINLLKSMKKINLLTTKFYFNIYQTELENNT